MPLAQRIIPSALSLANPELYQKDSGQDVLIDVNMARMSGTLQQLGALAAFSHQILGELFELTDGIAERVNAVTDRTAVVMEKMSEAEERVAREAGSGDGMADNEAKEAIRLRRQAQLQKEIEEMQKIFLPETMPPCIQDRYYSPEMNALPELELIDAQLNEQQRRELENEGAHSCSVAYSNPDYFFNEWMRREQEKLAEKAKLKAIRKEEKLARKAKMAEHRRKDSAMLGGTPTNRLQGTPVGSVNSTPRAAQASRDRQRPKHSVQLSQLIEVEKIVLEDKRRVYDQRYYKQEEEIIGPSFASPTLQPAEPATPSAKDGDLQASLHSRSGSFTLGTVSFKPKVRTPSVTSLAPGFTQQQRQEQEQQQQSRTAPPPPPPPVRPAPTKAIAARPPPPPPIKPPSPATASTRPPPPATPPKPPATPPKPPSPLYSRAPQLPSPRHHNQPLPPPPVPTATLPSAQPSKSTPPAPPPPPQPKAAPPPRPAPPPPPAIPSSAAAAPPPPLPPHPPAVPTAAAAPTHQPPESRPSPPAPPSTAPPPPVAPPPPAHVVPPPPPVQQASATGPAAAAAAAPSGGMGGALLSSIRAGPKLKAVTAQPKAAVEPPKNDLLAAIRGGARLKPVVKEEKPAVDAASLPPALGGFAGAGINDILARRKYLEADDSESDSDSNSDWGSD